MDGTAGVILTSTDFPGMVGQYSDETEWSPISPLAAHFLLATLNISFDESYLLAVHLSYLKFRGIKNIIGGYRFLHLDCDEAE